MSGSQPPADRLRPAGFLPACRRQDTSGSRSRGARGRFARSDASGGADAGSGSQAAAGVSHAPLQPISDDGDFDDDDVDGGEGGSSGDGSGRFVEIASGDLAGADGSGSSGGTLASGSGSDSAGPSGSSLGPGAPVMADGAVDQPSGARFTRIYPPVSPGGGGGATDSPSPAPTPSPPRYSQAEKGKGRATDGGPQAGPSRTGAATAAAAAFASSCMPTLDQILAKRRCENPQVGFQAPGPAHAHAAAQATLPLDPPVQLERVSRNRRRREVSSTSSNGDDDDYASHSKAKKFCRRILNPYSAPRVTLPSSGSSHVHPSVVAHMGLGWQVFISFGLFAPAHASRAPQLTSDPSKLHMDVVPIRELD
ncbi:hypothetical protein V5O48_017982 [Marasmius crinis-equi]|uniref:Uncharacterized protein n=1 Tax=Marasmius crinis-equi TaxID=585013 RepID=A0ABR3EMG8_9AGAR